MTALYLERYLKYSAIVELALLTTQQDQGRLAF